MSHPQWVDSLQGKGKQLLHNWIERLSPTLIRFGWAVFHALYGGDRRLWVTGITYMGNGNKRGKHMNMHVDEKSLNDDIFALKDAWRWIIILNHASWIFADYLPTFWFLGDDLLREATIYTAGFNLPMNEQEFPDYDFRRVNPKSIKDKKTFLTGLWERILEIEWWGWYLFIVPAWPGKDEGNKPFLAAFNHIVSQISSDTPILALRTTFDSDVTYGKILLARSWLATIDTTLESKITKASEWKWVPKQLRREYYNSLFKKSP